MRKLFDAGKSAAHRLDQLEQLVRVLTRDARQLALELRPPELDDFGLESALQTYVVQWGARYGIETDIALAGADGDHPLPMDLATPVYRIAQEALTNVARHADASHVSVVVERRANEVRLIVEDNGRGFNVETTRVVAPGERRFGLAGMQERAALVGGTVTLESSGQGTTVYARLPVGSP